MLIQNYCLIKPHIKKIKLQSINKIELSKFNKNFLFFLNYLYVVIIVILSPQSLIASEIETPSPDQSIPTGIYVKEGTTLVGEMNSTEVQSETIIYVSSGTTIVGEINISNSKIKNIVSNFDSNVEVNDDKNNILGVSKGFIPQQEVKDKILKAHQEKNIEKAKHTWFFSLSNPIIPNLGKMDFSIGIVNSTSSQFTFGTIQTIQKSCAFHSKKIRKETLCTSFLFVEKYKNTKIALRGPPSLFV